MITVIETSKINPQTLARIHAKCFFEIWNAEVFKKFSTQKIFHFILAENDERVCGFLIFSHIIDEVEIITNCVLPEFRKKGIGQSILQNLESYALRNSVNKIFLEVAEDNQQAISLYQKMNFQKISYRKNYYRKADQTFIDAIIMEKKIL